MENLSIKVAESEISYRPAFRMAELPQVTSSNEAYRVLMDRWDDGRLELLEEFKVILLNRRARVLGVVNISQGGFSGTVADPKVIFAVALKACASSIILAHNHPSGELSPSEADIWLTKRFAVGGDILGIKVHDHLVISKYGFYSFLDEGVI
ncbi:DNA repair protein RadC [Pedobacter sp. AK013]|uniref:JAB domain-containing protein n=1 Tax=Pedobacter sp. AK013 TaxID=2723071 RepID=UPI00162126C1|nr:JAB domain-containing protein [Pedobacter sp. AK013]MBB6240249.1 DNA repair protein RadC [Pedobacter sp. AK013]